MVVVLRANKIGDTVRDKPFYKSKKFWAAIIMVGAGFLNQYGIIIPPEVAYAAAAYLAGQAVADLGKNKEDVLFDTYRDGLDE